MPQMNCPYREPALIARLNWEEKSTAKSAARKAEKESYVYRRVPGPSPGSFVTYQIPKSIMG